MSPRETMKSDSSALSQIVIERTGFPLKHNAAGSGGLSSSFFMGDTEALHRLDKEHRVNGKSFK